MAHFAQLDDDNVVVNIVKTSNDEPDEGEKWLIENLGGRWVKSSYNTRGGVYYDPETGLPHEDQSKAFRGNHAGIGYTFDANLGPNGSFIPPQPYPSWILNEDTVTWEPPVEYPADFEWWIYAWDEETQTWQER